MPNQVGITQQGTFFALQSLQCTAFHWERRGLWLSSYLLKSYYYYFDQHYCLEFCR